MSFSILPKFGFASFCQGPAVVPIATALGASAATAATLGTIATVASTGLSIFGALKGAQGERQQGQSNAQAARYNAAVAANNATLARQNKDFASQRAQQETQAALMKTRSEVGAIKANQAASGIDLTSGSAVDVRSSAQETGQLSAIDIRTKAARQAYGYDIEAQSYDSQAKLDKQLAKNALEAGETNANTTLIGGISSAANGYSDYLDKRSFSGGDTWANGDAFR